MRTAFFAFVLACGISLAGSVSAFSWYGPGSGAYFTGWANGPSGFGFSWPWGFLDQSSNQLPAYNQAPSWIPVPPQAASVGAPLQFTVAAYDPEGAQLSYSAVNLPYGSAFDAASHMFSWTPTAAQVGTYGATFRASDRTQTADMTVSISVTPVPTQMTPSWYGNYGYGNWNQNTYVTPVNRRPQFYQIPPITVRAGDPVQFTVQAYDAEGDYLRYSNATVPSGARYDDYSHAFYWVPNRLQIGAYSIPFRVSDSRADYVEMSVSVTVTDPYGYLPYPTCTAGPGPYYFDFNPPTLVREGDLWSYQAIAGSGNIHPVTFRLVDGPPGMSIDQKSGYMRWVPAFNMGGGAYPVRIAAYNEQCEAMKNFSVTVTDVR